MSNCFRVTRKEILLLISFLILAAIPRGVFLLRNAGSIEIESGDDAWRHLTYATNLINTATFGMESGVPDAMQPPIYPLVLVPFVALFGWKPVVALWFQLLLVSAASGLCAVIGSRQRGMFAGLIAGGISAFYFPMVSYPTYFQTESLASFLFILALFFFDVTCTADKMRSAAGSAVINGAILALLSLTKFVTFPLCLISTFLIMFRKGFSARQRFMLGTLTACTFLIVFSPWVIRNTVQSGKVIVLSPKRSDTAGFAYYCAVNIYNGKSSRQARKMAKQELSRLEDEGLPSDLEVNRFSAVYFANCFQRFRIMIGEHPSLKIPFPFAGCKYGGSPPVHWANYLWTVAMYIGLASAIVIARVTWELRLAHLILLPASLVLLYSLIHAIPRYQAVTFFAWSIPAGIGWAFLLEQCYQRLRGMKERSVSQERGV